MNYICSHCTGATGEEHSFTLEREPRFCPWCGQKRHVKTLEEYLRRKLDDTRGERDRWKQKYRDLKDEHDELTDELSDLTLDSDHEWTDEEVTEFVERFDGSHI